MKSEIGNQKKTISDLKKLLTVSSSSEFPPLHSTAVRPLTHDPTLSPSPSFSSVLSSTSAHASVAHQPVLGSGRATSPSVSGASSNQIQNQPYTPAVPGLLCGNQCDANKGILSPSPAKPHSPTSVPLPGSQLGSISKGPFSPSLTTTKSNSPPTTALDQRTFSGPTSDPQQVQHTTQPTIASSSPSPVYSIPVHNRFSQLDPTALGTENKAIPVLISGERQRDKHVTSLNTLLQTNIMDMTDCLIVGDSTINKLKPEKMNTGQFHYVQKIAPPDLTTSDLNCWLDTLSPNPKISRLILHVGINDCKGGAIPTDQIKKILTKCTTKFPSAYIIVSSILPARGKHPMNFPINNSNANIKGVCDALNLVFIDNRTTFVAKSNAPKKDLYETPLIPSFKGLLKLARNLKYPTVDFNASSQPLNQVTAQQHETDAGLAQASLPYKPPAPTAFMTSPDCSRQFPSLARSSDYQAANHTDFQTAPLLDNIRPASLGTSTKPDPIQAITQALRLLQSLVITQ